ncbi:MAG: M1 family metallopeptidase [Polyangiaceae bacterium]|nr:M1 family metallopeptidase [Polyangiaceae bacterium]
MTRVSALAGLIGAAALALSCAASTDLTVPPPKVHPSFTIAIPEPLPSGRLPGLALPKRYELALVVDPAAERFSGEVVIDVVLPRDTPVVVLHAAELDISRAEALVGDERIALDHKARRASRATTEEEELLLVAPRPLPAGPARLRLVYTAPLADRLTGLYRVKEGDAWYAFTQLEPADARRVLPCFDDPAYKTPFDVSVTVPRGLRAFGNGPESELPGGGPNVTYRFATTPPMPTYLLALAVGPLEVRKGPTVPGSTVPLRLVAAKGKTALGGAALEVAAEELGILGDYFARPYPYDKLDLVAVPNFGAGAMENAGLITFREEILLSDPKSVSAATQRRLAATVAHELAHQWFGNLVTMQWWDDLWLNEGFATFMETVVADRYKPALGAGLELLFDTHGVMDLDALSSARAVRQPVRDAAEADEAFDGITYVKGASVIGMLRAWLGDEAFRAGLREYLAAHEWGSATAQDLFAALAKASGKDVSSVATTFLDRPGVPLVRAELRCEAGKPPAVALSQRRYAARPQPSTDAATWHIPVCVEWGDARGKPGGRDCGLLAEPSTTLVLSSPAGRACPDWINPNADYRGYYRFSLPSAGLGALERAASRGDARAKVGFLGNAWSLVEAGELGAERLLDMLLAAKGERERGVVEQVIGLLTRVSDTLVEPGARAAFQAYVSAILLPTAKRLGWDVRPRDSEDERLLRHAVLEALGALTADPWMLREAESRTRAYLQNPSSVDADAAAIAVRVAAHAGSPEASYDGLQKLLSSASSPEHRVNAVRALGSFADPVLLTRTFDLVLSGGIRAQDAMYVLRSAVVWPDTRERFVDWFARHLPELAEKLPGFAVSRMMAAVTGVCDEQRKNALEAALRPEVDKLGFGERRLGEALERVGLCIDLRARQAPAASAYLGRRRF